MTTRKNRRTTPSPSDSSARSPFDPRRMLPLVGVCASIALAQPQAEPPDEDVPANQADQPGTPRNETPQQRRAREALERRNADVARRRAEMERAMEGQVPNQPGVAPAVPGVNPAQPGAIQRPGQVLQPAGEGLKPDDQPVPDGAADHLQGDGMVRLNFGAEAISLDSFIDYVSLVLQINITPDPAVAQQQILFRAPIEIPKEDLLPFLAAIVEDKGFALVEDPLLGYFVRSAGAVPVQFEEGEFPTTRVIRIPMLRPSAVQAALTPLLGQSPAQLRYSPLDDIGVLIVSGPPRAVEMVEQFVERIIDEVANQSLHRYQLINVEAGFARSRVLTINGKLGGAAAPPVPGGAGGVASGALANLDSRIILDQGNALIFRGTTDEAEQVRQLVQMIDIVTPLTSKRYPAGSVALDVANAGQREGLGPITDAASGGAASGGGRPTLGAGGPFSASTSSEPDVNTSGFTVDSDTGSIIYTGTEPQHKRVAELVKSFTEQIIGSRVDIRRYKLHNAEAESVAELLTSLIEDESDQQTGTSPFLPGSRAQGLRQQTRPQPTLEPAEPGGEGEEGVAAAASGPVSISIVADPDRNQIIVKAPAKQQSEIEQIIKDLDERRPQVYIEAQIVAITANDDFNWTVETQVNAGQFLLFSSFGLSSAGTAAAGQQAAQAVRNVGTGNAGLTSAVIKSDYVPFILNTLQSKTDGRIISNPRILVNDNEQGEIASEREEPFATTTQGTATTTTGQGGVATAGTSLTVTPRISKGGYISLEYSIELSSFVGNPVAGLQPPTQRENYDSIVTIPSDSTIVVGGFTLSQNTESDRGIPILKDIPIIGALFKALTITNRRTTIFVFITPRIMTDPNFIDLRLISEGPMDKAEIDGITPPLEPVEIPILRGADAEPRLIPENKAPSGVTSAP